MDWSIVAAIIVGLVFIVIIVYVAKKTKEPGSAIQRLDARLDQTKHRLQSSSTYAIILGSLLLGIWSLGWGIWRKSTHIARTEHRAQEHRQPTHDAKDPRRLPG